MKIEQEPNAPAGGGQPERDGQTRDRKRPIRVFVNDDERAEIERRAAVAALPLSAYLRAAGLNEPLRPAYDYEAVRELVRVAGDLGRLGGLFKLWLSERRGEGATAAEVNRALHEARGLQDEIRTKLGRV